MRALLPMVGKRLGSDDTGELRDVLVILEKQGLVRVEVTPSRITVHLPMLGDDPPVTVARA
ncbi:MAG TPA: hypothetical protein VN667_15105 [Burkholderiales bacterium]|nr:hypothetical protein [Burkholderiales bacterium]